MKQRLCLWAAMLMALMPVIHAQTAGQLDPTFGTGGIAAVDEGGNPDTHPQTIEAMVVQPDGKIVVAGTAFDAQLDGDFVVARFNADGTLDTSFGSGGTASAGFDNARARAVFLEGGRILVAGHATFPASVPFDVDQQHLALARFDANGVLDPTFGDGGRQTSLLIKTNTSGFQVAAIVRQSDRSHVVVGTLFAQMFIARSQPGSAALDPFFGLDGVALSTSGLELSGADVLVQPDDGKAVVVGAARVAGNQNVAVLRFDTAGKLDETFGDGGIVTTDVQGTDLGRAVALQPDGAIVVAAGAGGDLALVRYLSDGRRDLAFGTDGKVITDVQDGDDLPEAIALQPDGKIVIAGRIRETTAPFNGDVVVARYNADGSRDLDFGDDGLTVTDVDGVGDAVAAEQVRAVRILADGKILVAGGGEVIRDGAPQSDFMLARYEGVTPPEPQADVRIAKIGPNAPVDVGTQVTFALTVANGGPDAATDVVVRDPLPAGLTFVSCEASAGGVCGIDNGVRTIAFGTIASGQSRTATLTVTLGAAVPDGTTITNSATVITDTKDSDLTNNVSSATIVARAVPHALRFFLHGTDVPGTANGFTMNLTPSAPQAIRLNLAQSPAWFGDPAMTGRIGAGATFRLVRPCTLGLSVGATYRLAKTNLAGGAAQPLGQTQRLIAPCIGQEVIAIPVPTPVTLANERLRLTISSTLGVNLDLQLGEGTFFEVTNFAGVP